MKKPLNEEAISSELRGGSVFFRSPQPGTGPASRSGPTVPDDARMTPAVVPAIDSPSRSAVRPTAPASGRRVIGRHAFEIYQDQLETLRRIALEGQLAGDKITMSQMVREALDAYIARTRGER